MPNCSKGYLSTSCLWIYNLVVLKHHFRWCRSIIFHPFLFFFFFFFFFCNLVFRHKRLFSNKNLLDIRFFFLAGCLSQIYCCQVCLFEQSCLHRWLESYVRECVEQGKIAIEIRDIRFISGIGGTVSRNILCAEVAVKYSSYNSRMFFSQNCLVVLRHEDWEALQHFLWQHWRYFSTQMLRQNFF